MAATKIKYIYWIMRDCLIVSMCRDVVTSFEELLCAGVGCRPGYQGGAGQGRGHNQKTREQAASLHQPHRGTCTVTRATWVSSLVLEKVQSEGS